MDQTRLARVVKLLTENNYGDFAERLIDFYTKTPPKHSASPSRTNENARFTSVPAMISFIRQRVLSYLHVGQEISCIELMDRIEQKARDLNFFKEDDLVIVRQDQNSQAWRKTAERALRKLRESDEITLFGRVYQINKPLPKSDETT